MHFRVISDESVESDVQMFFQVVAHNVFHIIIAIFGLLFGQTDLFVPGSKIGKRLGDAFPVFIYPVSGLEIRHLEVLFYSPRL